MQPVGGSLPGYIKFLGRSGDEDFKTEEEEIPDQMVIPAAQNPEPPAILKDVSGVVKSWEDLNALLSNYLIQVERVCNAWPEDNEDICRLREELTEWMTQEQDVVDLDGAIDHWETTISDLRENDSSFANEELPTLTIKR